VPSTLVAFFRLARNCEGTVLRAIRGIVLMAIQQIAKAAASDSAIIHSRDVFDYDVGAGFYSSWLHVCGTRVAQSGQGRVINFEGRCRCLLGDL
jgi:hypothetical protein